MVTEAPLRGADPAREGRVALDDLRDARSCEDVLIDDPAVRAHAPLGGIRRCHVEREAPRVVEEVAVRHAAREADEERDVEA